MNQAKITIATQGDDLGTNHTTNLAFVEAYSKGLLRQAAILTCCPSIEEAAAMLAGEKGLGISLHTCMNCEWDSYKWGPVAPHDKVGSLIDKEGNFFQTGVALFENKPRIEEILIELQAQLDKARDLGFDVKFADAHMGWTWILKEHELVFHEWRKRNGLQDHKKYAQLPQVNCLADPVESLILKLKRAAPGQYSFGGHPSYDNEEMRGLGHPGYEGDIVATSRDWERRIFTDPRIIDYCLKNDIQPIRHDEAL